MCPYGFGRTTARPYVFSADRRQTLRAVAQGRHGTPRCSAPFARCNSPPSQQKRGTILQEQGERIDRSSGSS